MRPLGYWLGGLVELLSRLHRPLGWRAWQTWRRGLIHARDLGACLAAIGMLALVVYLVGE